MWKKANCRSANSFRNITGKVRRSGVLAREREKLMLSGLIGVVVLFYTINHNRFLSEDICNVIMIQKKKVSDSHALKVSPRARHK